MFELKKIISVFINMPGIFILFLIITGFFGFRKKIFLLKLNILAGFILYCVSISLVSNNIIGIIEKGNVYNGKPPVDVIILLGGGIVEGVPDISGTSIPSSDMTVRLVDAVRLYKKYKLPIIVSGGTLSDKVKEAVVVGRFLMDLGVKQKDIFLEDLSRDTVENALYVKAIFIKRGFKRGLLITSGYHMRRAEYLFKKTGMDVFPHSTGLLSGKKSTLNFYDFLPNTGDLNQTAIAVKEAVGLVFYFIKYGVLKISTA